jgi:alpha-1,6-mannosyltransferase
VPAGWLADQFNRSTARSYDVVLCTTAWAPAEYRRLGVPNLLQVPLGVDLACFHPGRRDESLRSRLAPGGQALLVHCSRLSPEKRPQRALGALAELRRRGLPAVLVVAGDVRQRRSLQAQARGLPVRLLRHISDAGSGPAAHDRRRGDRARAGRDVGLGPGGAGRQRRSWSAARCPARYRRAG